MNKRRAVERRCEAVTAQEATNRVPRLSVVIPTHNRCASVVRLIRSLAEQRISSDEFEIIVVDDGSRDETPARLAALSATVPNLRWCRQPNGGVSAARNRGARLAHAPLIAFLDDDEVVPPGWIQRVLDLADQHPELAGLGGPCTEGRSKLRLCARCQLLMRHERGHESGPTQWLPGGNMVLQRAALLDIGPFHEGLREYEEPEWFQRARERGYRFGYFPELAVIHAKDLEPRWASYRREFRRGRGRPIAERLAGREPRLSSHLRAMARPFAHAVRYRCEGGLLVGLREVGSAFEVLRARLQRHPSRSPGGATSAGPPQ